MIRARHFVASSLNPHQTFLDLLDERSVPRALREQVERFRYNLLAPLFALHLNLREPPRYRASGDHPELAQAFMVILGLDHVDQFGEIVRHHEAGTIPPPVMWGACPTLFDPSQAPPGRHTAFMWEKLPYRLHGDPGELGPARRRARPRPCWRLWRSYAPNLADAVIDSFTRTPLDVERCLPNMREGDLLVGAFANGQVGHDRPFAGAGDYRTHLSGLYLCGSSSHPGGNITGLPGYNAAQVILADLGIDAPVGAAADRRAAGGDLIAAENISRRHPEVLAHLREPCRSARADLRTCSSDLGQARDRWATARVPSRREQAATAVAVSSFEGRREGGRLRMTGSRAPAATCLLSLSDLNFITCLRKRRQRPAQRAGTWSGARRKPRKCRAHRLARRLLTRWHCRREALRRNDGARPDVDFRRSLRPASPAQSLRLLVRAACRTRSSTTVTPRQRCNASRSRARSSATRAWSPPR